MPGSLVVSGQTEHDLGVLLFVSCTGAAASADKVADKVKNMTVSAKKVRHVPFSGLLYASLYVFAIHDSSCLSSCCSRNYFSILSVSFNCSIPLALTSVRESSKTCLWLDGVPL